MLTWLMLTLLLYMPSLKSNGFFIKVSQQTCSVWDPLPSQTTIQVHCSEFLSDVCPNKEYVDPLLLHAEYKVYSV